MSEEEKSNGCDSVKISRKDLYCIARLLQASRFGRNIYVGCRNCKYKCSEDASLPNFDKVMFRLQELTGIDMDVRTMPFEKRVRNEKSHCWHSDF